MPKKSRKRLTQPKGTSYFYGKSTIRSNGNNSSISFSDDTDEAPSSKRSKIGNDMPSDILDISLHTSLDISVFSSPESSTQRINILQNVLVVPAQGSCDNLPILKKCKKRLAFHSFPVNDDDEFYGDDNDSLPYGHAPKPRNSIQHILQLKFSYNYDTDLILEEVGLEDERSMIYKMIDIYPSTLADLLEAGPSYQDVIDIEDNLDIVNVEQLSNKSSMSPPNAPIEVHVMIHNVASGSPVRIQQKNPALRVIPLPVHLPPQQLDAITFDLPNQVDNPIQIDGAGQAVADLDQALIDLHHEEQLDEQERIRAATRNRWRMIANLQRQVNHLRNVNHTYLRATDRFLRNPPSYLGPLTHMCTFCSALHFRGERTRRLYTKCCREGKVALPPLRQMPDLLKNLFQGLHQHSPNFKQNVLRYNYAFQFISLEANLRQLPRGRAPLVYAIQGKIYHHLSNVNVNDPVQRYGPIYFLTPEEAVHQRNQNNDELNLNIIESIENLLRDVNPYAQAYMHLRNRYHLELQTIERLRANAARLNLDPPLEMPLVTLELLTVRGANNRQFDVPAIEEVAAVYNHNPDNPPTPTLKVYVRNNPTVFQNVSQESEILDPLVFPLLLPLGDRGWYINMPHANGNRKVTLCEYYAYRLAIRDNDYRFQYGGMLTQQYIVAAYIKIEANRLKYIRLNQDKLRANHYVGLADYLNQRIHNDDEAATLGKMVILPSTYIGNPRHQQQLFQDSMAVVGRFGAPSLFITITCNPTWREITENIPRGTQPSNHPMLIARVFQTKLNEFIKEILDKHIFGVPIANLYVIEFQKRGLPHAHILTILEEPDKLIDPERIDLLISAEIPDPNLEPELYTIVTKNMIHGPCGAINPNSPCMKDNICSKNYPKPFSPETTIDNNGKLTYRRRNNGRTFTTVINGDQYILDNRWVVPYNAYVLLKYSCHCNVEACATIECVKYLYKYFFKDLEQALLKVNADHQVNYDEIETYLSARYMSPPEACWHINQFVLHKNTHSVIRLCVHLLERQIVRFQPGLEVQALQRNEVTQLTAWFTLNQNDPQAHQYLYTEIPYHYVWQATTRRWTQRQRRGEKTVVRMYSISIRQQELYYLRLLLLHVRGACSYEDVRTVEGIVYNTFLEACQQRNLLADDTEWIRALQEANERQMPCQLRQMFAYMLLFCEISDKQTLLARFLDAFIEDFTRRDIPREEAIRLALTTIQETLILHGARLSQFGLPEPVFVTPRYDIIDVDTERVRGEELRNQLNPGQTDLFHLVMDSVHSNDLATNRLFLINSRAGVGKSFLFQTLISVLRGQNIPVIALAPTGLAASLLRGGRTIHSRFKLPIDINETTTSGVTPASADGRLIAQSKLIIIDEISMVTRTTFNLVEKALRDICTNNRPFANKTILLAGDFRQTLPILRDGNRCSIVNSCIQGSRHFPSFIKHNLHINVRAGEHEVIFSRWLLQLGDGTLPSFRRTFYGDIIELPSECIVNSKQELIDFCFADLHMGTVAHTVILTPLNAVCNDINELILDKLPNTSRTYFSADSVDLTDDPAAQVANYTVEFLNTLNPSGMPPHKLTLKVGAIIMLLRNLNLKGGLCNGTRLLIRVLGTRYIDAEKIDTSGNLTGVRVFIPRIDLTPASDILPFKLKRRQFPVRLSYALTINKSQGQTFDKIGIYLPQPVFAHGQLYVAFSRARNFQSIRTFVEQTSIQGRLNPPTETMYTRNIVYREVL